MSRIKVVVGVNDMLMGGVQRLAIDLLNTLDRDTYDLELVVLRQFPGKGTLDELIPAGIPVHQLHFKGLADVSQWLQLYRLLRSIRPDIVKTATFFSNTVFLALRPLFGYVVVAAEHNTLNRKPSWQRMVDRLLLPQACTVVGDSKQVVEFVAEAEGIDPKHFTVVYNGVDMRDVAEAEAAYGPERSRLRAAYGVPEHAPLMFTAARLINQKNHRLMIEGFKRVLGKYPDARLLIAGDGPLRNELEAQIQAEGLAESVTLLGEQIEIYKFYAIADVFLLTSRHEGFCIAAMEGLAFGMPLISTRVAGVSEYLEDGKNGFFVDANPEDIAENLTKVIGLSPDERARFAAAGKATAAAFSIERYGKAYDELFRRCVGR